MHAETAPERFHDRLAMCHLPEAAADARGIRVQALEEQGKTEEGLALMRGTDYRP